MKGIREWMVDEGFQLDEASEMIQASEVKAAFEKGVAKLKKEIASELVEKLNAPKVKDVFNTFAFKRKGKDIKTFSPSEVVASTRAAVELLFGAICRDMGLNEKDLDRLVAKAYGFNPKDVQKYTLWNAGK